MFEVIRSVYTARKAIFSFSRRPEKMVFPKKSCWNMIFLVLSGKIMFPFPKNVIFHLRRKMKDDLPQKNTRKYDIFFKLSEKMGFSKKAAIDLLKRDTIFLVLSGKMVFFPPEIWHFFLGQEVIDDLSQEIHGDMIFSVYTLKMIDVLDLHPRKTSSNSPCVFMHWFPAKKTRNFNM